MKHLFLAAAIAVSAFSGANALTAEEAFKTAPSTVFPLIEPGTRLDMIDYFNAGVDRAARNTLYGDSRITAMTPATITVQVSKASRTEIVTMPVSDNDTAIVVISTVDTPAPDSKVSIYDRDWQLLTTVIPPLEQWVINKKDRNDVEELLPYMIVSCGYSPDTDTFVFTNHTAGAVGKEVYEPLRPMLRDYLVYGYDPKKRTLTWLGPNTANSLDNGQNEPAITL